MAKGILADNDVQGHLEILLRIWLWASLKLVIFTFEELGLDRNTSDLTLWQECQIRDIVLFTANRNDAGPHSLESAIRKQSTANALPVFTISNSQRLLTDHSYATRVAIKLLQFFLEIDSLRGTGRLFVP